MAFNAVLLSQRFWVLLLGSAFLLACYSKRAQYTAFLHYINLPTKVEISILLLSVLLGVV